MKPMNRDMMVERYLSRRMSAAEEMEFRRLLGADPELRAMLETEQTIRRTLYRDRDALPAVSAESRFNVLTMLGNLASAERGAATGAAGGGHGISMLAGGVAKGIIIAVAGIGIVMGGIFIARGGLQPPVDHPAERPAAAPTATGKAPAPAISPQPVPASPAISDVAPQPTLEPTAKGVVARRPASPPLHQSPIILKREAVRPDPAPAEAPVQQPAQPRADSAAHHRDAATRDTSMRVKVTIDMNRLRQHP